MPYNGITGARNGDYRQTYVRSDNAGNVSDSPNSRAGPSQHIYAMIQRARAKHRRDIAYTKVGSPERASLEQRHQMLLGNAMKALEAASQADGTALQISIVPEMAMIQALNDISGRAQQIMRIA